MPDINAWRLEYPGKPALDFGTMASNYPFEVQADIGDVNVTTQDSPHPSTDGEVFGIDAIGGFPITFRCRVIDDNLQADKWNQVLDRTSSFKSMWRASSLRREAGAYATLANLERNRLVYGRPRALAETHKRLRKGLVDFSAQFKSNGPNWYSLTEKMVELDLISGPSFGFNSPITAPITTTGATVDDMDVDNDGDEETWSVIELYGPGSGWNLALRQGGQVLWRLESAEALKFDEVMTIDTRPWARGVTINGRPANGRLLGTSISRTQIPVGNFKFRLQVKDGTGTAKAKIYWRDAYASL